MKILGKVIADVFVGGVGGVENFIRELVTSFL